MVGLWLRLRDSFWVVPALLCATAVVLAEVVLAVDRNVLVGETFLGPLLNEAGASGSRDLLGTVAGSMLSVAGTMFSITMAVLALTSSSYGPRLVRNFMSDRGNQVVLGTFLATFLYALIVLRAVRSSGDSGDRAQFVPHLAVTLAVVLAVVCVAVLVYFIHHISDSIQVATLSGRVRGELRDTVERMYPAEAGQDVAAVKDAGSPDLPADLPGATRVEAGAAGYVAAIDLERLLRIGREHDRVVILAVRPGDHVLADDTVARVWPPSEKARSVELVSAVQRALTVGRNRTPYQDVSFAVRQLVELAVRALSPGTNDPFTAQNALDDLTVGLALMAARPTPSARRYDDQGRLRVVAEPVTVGELVDQVMDAMRTYALSAPDVVLRTLDLAQAVGVRAESPDVRTRLHTQVRLLVDAFRREAASPRDVRRVAERADQVFAAVAAHP